MPVPRILLLRTGAPDGKNAGIVLLEELCKYYPKNSLCCFSLIPNIDGTFPKQGFGFPTYYSQHPREWGSKLTSVASIDFFISVLHQRYIRNVHVPRLLKQIVRFTKHHQVDLVWAVLTSPTMIYISKRVADSLGVPLVVTVMDPPERFTVDQKMDTISRSILLTTFEQTLKSAVRCGLASEGMQFEYKKRYGIESIVQILGVHPSLRHNPAQGLNNKTQFIIGFAGNLYASDEWNALLSALDSINWCLEGREVVIKVLGPAINKTKYNMRNIECFGWQSVEDTINIMSHVDICYLPYWFNDYYKLSVRLCFPGKISTYLAAGRPILFHGPKKSTPADFFHHFPVGICCHSLDSSDILKSLKRFITEPELYESTAKAGQNALDEELDLRVFLRRFAELIGIEENQLLPILSAKI